ncbi:MAG: SGNH/GDSL hydrolase family protein [Kiritimatiellaeota bacterium]|nr:SGNH/GDSL hydrolase family protein [Kiritimatiellota bacterium]
MQPQTDTGTRVRKDARRWLGPLLTGLVDGLFFIALLILPLVWLANPLHWKVGPLHLTVHWGWKPVLAPVLLLLAGAGLRRSWLARGLLGRPSFQKPALALISIYLFMAAFEGMLAWRGFAAHLPPVVFVGQNNAGGKQVVDTLPDPELIFRFKPGSLFEGRRINQLGFRDREVEVRKKPGTRRVVCLGDSVTGQGLPGYPQLLHERLQTAPPTPEAWEALNLGVHGYSVLQGLRLFERLGAALQPDVVTIYFGWNDHWLSTQSDRSQMAVKMAASSGRLYAHLRTKRSFMFLSTLLNPAHRWLPHYHDRWYRVPPEEYRDVLGRLIDAVRAAGAVPVVITAPRRGLPETLMQKSYAESVAKAEQIHARYVELTRDEARRHGAVLLDLAVLFAGPECDRYFAPDGIHFDLYPKEHFIEQPVPPEAQPGLTRVAAELHRTLQTVVLSDAWQTRPSR